VTYALGVDLGLRPRGGTLDVAPLRKTSDRFELVGEPFGRPVIGGLDLVEAKERLSVEMSVDIAIPLAAEGSQPIRVSPVRTVWSSRRSTTEGTAARLLPRFTIRAAPSHHTAAAVNVVPRSAGLTRGRGQARLVGR
jgi:hypothetical protein